MSSHSRQQNRPWEPFSYASSTLQRQHAIFNRDEVVKRIIFATIQPLLPIGFGWMDDPLPQSVHERLVDLALVSNIFFSVAISFLWNIVHGEVRLFRAVDVSSRTASSNAPKLKSKPEQQTRSHLRDEANEHDEVHADSVEARLMELILQGNIRVSSLPRFRQYTSQVKRVSISSNSVPLGNDVYSRMQKLLGTVTLFPHLVYARIPMHFLRDTRADFFLKGSSIENLHLHMSTLSTKPRVISRVTKLHDEFPTLKGLALEVFGFWKSSNDFVHNIIQSPILNHIVLEGDITTTTDRVLPVLLASPSLSSIKFMPEFPTIAQHITCSTSSDHTQLSTYSVTLSANWVLEHDAYLPVIQTIAHYGRLNNLSILSMPCLRTTTSEVAAAAFNNVVSALATCAPHLQQLLVTYVVGSPVPIITTGIEIFRPLLSLGFLEEFDVTFDRYAVVLNEADVSEMTLRWPRLRRFELQCPSLPASSPLSILQVFAQNAPLLERLKLPLDAAMVPNVVERKSHGLSVLVPQFTRLETERVPDVAAFLRHLFIKLKIEGVYMVKEVQLAEAVQASR